MIIFSTIRYILQGKYLIKAQTDVDIKAYTFKERVQIERNGNRP